jgi:hypothetical protein
LLKPLNNIDSQAKAEEEENNNKTRLLSHVDIGNLLLKLLEVLGVSVERITFEITMKLDLPPELDE